MIDYLRFIIYDFAQKIVSKNETLYLLWLKKLVNQGKQPKNLPSKTDDYYFDGYPRSGNTYTKVLLYYAFKELKGASHFHSIAAINIALRCQIPIFIIIRNPLDVVGSNMFRKVENNSMLSLENLADHLLKKYIRYYAHVEKNLHKINIVSFGSLIGNQSTFLEEFADLFSHQIDNESGNNFDTVIELVDQRMKDREKSKRDAISSLPNDIRRQFKIDNQNKILNSSYYDKATAIYHRLTQNDIIVKNHKY